VVPCRTVEPAFDVDRFVAMPDEDTYDDEPTLTDGVPVFDEIDVEFED
jgi:hypothetical protein